jgi:hypothetical protein
MGVSALEPKIGGGESQKTRLQGRSSAPATLFSEIFPFEFTPPIVFLINQTEIRERQIFFTLAALRLSGFFLRL